ncbi:hypothetical protein PIROE2DRAFT_10270 [Piromyces sp. E2]|nr:hypothetical protein PIROE2DRAFT_10270 [Piromyces sp. E2]|eukprot:OUM63243.1 hypothetical protein PIROE2DRAFT_10270 [Piromyces sp. E2]
MNHNHYCNKNNNCHIVRNIKKEDLQTSSNTINSFNGIKDPIYDENSIHESPATSFLSFNSPLSFSYNNPTTFSSIEMSHCPEDILSKCWFESQYDNPRPSLFNQFTLSESSKPISSTKNSLMIHNNDTSQVIEEEDLQSLSDHSENNSNDETIVIDDDDSPSLISTTESSSSSILSGESYPSVASCSIDDPLSKYWFQSQYNNLRPSLFNPLTLLENEKPMSTTNSFMTSIHNNDGDREVKREIHQSYSEHSNDNEEGESVISKTYLMNESSSTSPTTESPISSSTSFYDAFPPPYDTSPSTVPCNHNLSNAVDHLSKCWCQYHDDISSSSSLIDQFILSENSKPIFVNSFIMNNDDNNNTFYQEVKEENQHFNSNYMNGPKDDDSTSLNSTINSSNSIPLTITPITTSIIFDIPSCETSCSHIHCYKREHIESPLTKCHFHTENETPCCVHSDQTYIPGNSKSIWVRNNIIIIIIY